MFSCKRTNPVKADQCEFICLQENDSTLRVRIANHGKSKIYVPDEYIACFTDNSDTIHLESFINPAYNKDHYYLYRNLFPYKVATAEKIRGHEPDSIITLSKSIAYNQFRASPVIPVLPDSVYYGRIVFTVPIHANRVSAVFYKKGYQDDAHMRFITYSYEDFQRFEKQQAGYLSTALIKALVDRK
jgi:hypothetical protein